MAFRARTLWVPLPPLALLLMGMGGCGGRESVEDAPALLGTSIPAAAPSAEGVDMPSALVRGPRLPTRSKPPPPVMKELESPFGTPSPSPPPSPSPIPVPAPPAKSSPSELEL